MVCLIGLDGSGKTRHALTLQKVLKRKGFQCALVTPRSALIKHMPSLIRRWIDQHGHLSPRNLTAFSNKRPSLLHHLKAFPLNLVLSLCYIGYGLATYLVCIKPYLREKRTIVILDRYFYDSFYNLWGHLSVYLIKALPSPDLVFVLDIPASQAFKRMHSVEDKSIPYEYYEQLRQWYIFLGTQRNFLLVDTSDDFETANSKMINQI